MTIKGRNGRTIYVARSGYPGNLTAILDISDGMGGLVCSNLERDAAEAVIAQLRLVFPEVKPAVVIDRPTRTVVEYTNTQLAADAVAKLAAQDGARDVRVESGGPNNRSFTVTRDLELGSMKGSYWATVSERSAIAQRLDK